MKSRLEVGNELKILFINVQGLTKPKLLELQEFVDNRTILCLAETQHKYDKLNVRGDIDKYVCMRSISSKKGGGLMVLKRKDTNIQFDNIYSLHEDCMIIDCKIKGLSCSQTAAEISSLLIISIDFSKLIHSVLVRVKICATSHNIM